MDEKKPSTYRKIIRKNGCVFEKAENICESCTKNTPCFFTSDEKSSQFVRRIQLK
jgi:hypothetical protein